ncbi:MAG: hypothetical protein D6744_00205 [Planctomycetota bacterium]|nr:MAG: hypothetical protein D6744_00205 [Planctomycetota bacterium]
MRNVRRDWRGDKRGLPHSGTIPKLDVVGSNPIARCRTFCDKPMQAVSDAALPADSPASESQISLLAA